jgi:hypothetical protein
VNPRLPGPRKALNHEEFCASIPDTAGQYTSARSSAARGIQPEARRLIRLFDRANFGQWIRLEADPTVLLLCERPLRLSPDVGSRVVDFWVQREDGEQLLLVGDGETELLVPTGSDIPLRLVAAADRAAAAMWIANWQWMLPTIISTQAWRPNKPNDRILAAVGEPMSLSRLERAFAMGDPSVVRGAIFELLRSGRLSAPSLHSHRVYQARQAVSNTLTTLVG